MELIELQNKWNAQSELMNNNINLNSKALKRIIRQNQKERTTKIKIEAVFNLVLPIVLIAGMLIPKLIIRYDFTFFLGLSLFSLFFILTYYWAIKYAMLVFRINFSNNVLIIRKEVAELEKYKFSITRLGFFMSPIGIASMFMMMGFPVISKHAILPISILLVVMIISIVVTFKYTINGRFQELNKEISELEKLEKEL